ncbi:hypothetical protein BD311DRAFT_749000 [Dichomitus squalens]|uniref:Uncharacterized protein n=1 Tax=Dichomitus squalens TaxID=114155 RepID=A0A4Q9MY11_9APHY|nr:hypothetical protein BD311DRAFT_749000 [Dichomitus squalens]
MCAWVGGGAGVVVDIVCLLRRIIGRRAVLDRSCLLLLSLSLAWYLMGTCSISCILLDLGIKS